MLINIIDRIKLPFRKEKELYSSLYQIIGLYPHNISFYKMALMHKSVMHRNKKGKPVNNERLEFLGDAILDAAVGDIVYRHFPGKREGFLTNTRSKLVQRETLNKLANELGINKLILSSGHSLSHNSYMGGNAFEALVGALYLDRGYDACMVFLKERILKQMINIDKVAYKEVNFKSKLIEWSQGCCGNGFSKKESQQNASQETLNRLRKEPQFIDQVFAAKAERTKMEEEPTEPIPDTNPSQVFMVTSNHDDNHDDKHETTFRESVFTENESAAGENNEESASKNEDTRSKSDEFDLSDISSRVKDKEEIIAAAEQAAFNDGQ